MNGERTSEVEDLVAAANVSGSKMEGSKISSREASGEETTWASGMHWRGSGVTKACQDH